MSGAVISELEMLGVDVLTLSEGLTASEFLRSRITRHEVQRQVLSMAKLLNDIEPLLRDQLPEIDWSGWEMMARRIHNLDEGSDDALWFCVQALTPATVIWLRQHQVTQPERALSIRAQDNSSL
jgi:uncharacterized protein with HEPN domain